MNKQELSIKSVEAVITITDHVKSCIILTLIFIIYLYQLSLRRILRNITTVAIEDR